MFARLCSLFFAAAVVLAASPVLAQSDEDRARAREEFNRGVERYEAGDYAGALEAFQEAYRLAPHPSVRVNMANCYEELDRPLEAKFHYERFLQETEEGGNAAQRREVQQALENLESEIGRVTFRIAPDGARVTIDGAETRRAPILAPVFMTPGNHTLEVSLDGYQTVRREFIVEGGAPANVEVRLERGSGEAQPMATAPTEPAAGVSEPGPGAPPSAAAAPASTAQTGGDVSMSTDDGGGFALSTPVIIAGAATGALLVGGIVTGVIALGAESEFDDKVIECNRGANPIACDEGRDAASTADTMALLSDIFFVGAIVGAGVTTYLFLTQDDGGTERVADEPRVTPVAMPEGAGVVVDGSF